MFSTLDFKNNENAIYGRIYRAYYGKLTAFASSLMMGLKTTEGWEPEDVVSDCIILLHKNSSKIKDEAHIKYYLLHAIRLRCSHLRRNLKIRHGLRSQFTKRIMEMEYEHILRDIEQKQRDDLCKRLINLIPEPYKSALVNSYVKDGEIPLDQQDRRKFYADKAKGIEMLKSFLKLNSNPLMIQEIKILHELGYSTDKIQEKLYITPESIEFITKNAEKMSRPDYSTKEGKIAYKSVINAFSPEVQRACELLLKGRRIPDIAKELGYGRETVNRWRQRVTMELMKKVSFYHQPNPLFFKPKKRENKGEEILNSLKEGKSVQDVAKEFEKSLSYVKAIRSKGRNAGILPIEGKKQLVA